MSHITLGEASDCGANILWYDDQPPAIVEEEALFEDKQALVGFKAPDPLSGGRMEDRVRGIELLRQHVGEELFVEGWVEGPCAEGSDLRGISRLMLDFSDDPKFVRDLFEFSVEGAIRFAAAQIEAGADIIGIGDAAVSLTGPRIYNEVVWHWEKKLVDAIHAMGGRVRLHMRLIEARMSCFSSGWEKSSLALVHSGDMIILDVPGRLIQLEVDDPTLDQRRKHWTPV